jgi:hypothetical protein
MGVNAQTAVPAFVAGEVLTAAEMTQVNTGIPVFATTVTRDAAFGGAGEKVLAEGQFAYIEATNTTQYYSGSSWESLNSTSQIAIFNESQASGTNGGTFNSGSYIKRTLNTTVVNTITSCTLTASVISLPAGTYTVTAFAPSYTTGRNRLRIENTTDSAVLQLGENAFCDVLQAPAVLQATFTLAGTKNIELQHRAQNTVGTNGLGIPCSFGDSEVYATIQIEKTA